MFSGLIVLLGIIMVALFLYDLHQQHGPGSKNS
jgi:hypothetical protein